MRLTGVKKPTLVYLGTATYDADEPFHSQTDGFAEDGVRLIKLDVSDIDNTPSTASISSTISSADIA